MSIIYKQVTDKLETVIWKEWKETPFSHLPFWHRPWGPRGKCDQNYDGIHSSTRFEWPNVVSKILANAMPNGGTVLLVSAVVRISYLAAVWKSFRPFHTGKLIPWGARAVKLIEIARGFLGFPQLLPRIKSISDSSDNVTSFEVSDMVIRGLLCWSGTERSSTYHTTPGVRGLSSTFWSGTSPSSHGRVYGHWSSKREGFSELSVSAAWCTSTVHLSRRPPNRDGDPTLSAKCHKRVRFFCDILAELAGWFRGWISFPLATDLIRLLVSAFCRLSQPEYCSYNWWWWWRRRRRRRRWWRWRWRWCTLLTQPTIPNAVCTVWRFLPICDMFSSVT